MILFDFVMTVFEDFLITYFIFSYFLEEKKLQKIFILSTICVIETYIFNNYFLNNEFLLILLISTWAISLIIFNKKINLMFFVIPSLLMGLLLVSNILSFYLTSLIFNVKINVISTYTYLTVISILISRIVFLIACIKLYSKLKTIRLEKYDLFEFKPFIIFVICLFSIVTTIGQSIVYNSFDYSFFIIVVIEFIVMSISAIVLFICIQRNSVKKIELETRVNELEYSKKLYFEACKLSYQFSREKHKLYYVLKQIEDISIQEKCSNANLIQNALKEIGKIDISYTSCNPIYDYMITKKIIDLKYLNYDVIYTANLSEIEIFTDTILIGNIEQYINLLTLNTNIDTSENRSLIINVLEKGNYIVLELIVDIYLELSNQMFEFAKKSNYIVKESIHCDSNSSTLKVLIKNASNN